MKLFAILSDGGLLKAGNTTLESLAKLKANGFEQVHHSEDFLCALADGENAFFFFFNQQDIESLYDECNVFSLNYSKKESLLQAYAKQLINSQHLPLAYLQVLCSG